MKKTITALLFVIHTFGSNDPFSHHNEGAKYLKEGNFTGASKELLQAVELHWSPFARVKELEYVRDIQRSLGIQHSTLEKSYLLGLLAISRELILLLSMITFWCFFVFFYLSFMKRRKFLFLPLAGGILFVLGTGIFLLLRSVGSLAVLQGSEDIAIYSTSEMTEKIVTLPPGTVVRLKAGKMGNFQIFEPVYGWIKSGDFQKTELPAFSG